MQTRFDNAISRLTASPERLPSILFAVSGGVDSMVMLSLAAASGAVGRIAVAHMNFSLRGDESDSDEALVRKWCVSSGVESYFRTVDTRSYAKSRNISIEMAARELRYAWFAELLADHDLDFVAVAHNLNDNVETLYLNLLRGTGLRGMTGIRQVNGRIIRPMMEFSRDEISKYAISRGIRFNVDSTNLESEYSRNRIRNEVFPEFEKINPSYLRSVSSAMTHLAQAQDYISDKMAEEADAYSSMDGDVMLLDIDALRADKYRAFRLYSLLDGYGFNEAQLTRIAASVDASSTSGKRFASPTHVLIRDRKYLKVYPLDEAEADLSQMVKVEIMDNSSSFNPKSAPVGVLYADADKLNLPLTFRRWQPADRFCPLGMHNFRKLSDFFTAIKMDVEQKRRQIIVTTRDDEDREQIVCIAGLRIDDRYRITPETRRIAVISI